jgi:peroxiredoxin
MDSAPASADSNPSADVQNSTAPAAKEIRKFPLGSLLFCVLLILVGCVLLAITVKRMLNSGAEGPTDMQQVNIAEDAKKFLHETKKSPLSEPLEKILEEAKRVHFESDQNSLVGKPAPDISTTDVDGKPWSLKDQLKKGPVIVVFYLGYWCNHCVSQLFDVNEDINRFRELGADVVALSPDTAGTTQLRYKEYGRFDFPVIADVNNHIAQSYGVYKPAKGDQPEDSAHGTFVIDQKGIIRWMRIGTAPFGHNPTLIYELAKIKGLVKETPASPESN